MGELVTAFGLGNTAILNNVCLLPLYPGLMAFLAGNADTTNTKARMGFLGAIVLAGVLTMMTLVALLLHLFNAVTNDILPVLLPIIYGVVLLLGVAMIVGYNPWSRLQQMQAPIFKNPNATAYMYGLLLGPMTLPCIAPLIITAFALGSDDASELIDGIAYFLAFGLGFGWPLVALPLVAGTTQRRFIGWMTKNHALLTRVSGILLIGIAILGFVTEVVPTLGEEDVDTDVARWTIGDTLVDHTETVATLAFDASGETLYSAGGVGNSGLFATGTDFELRQWNLDTRAVDNRVENLSNRTESLVVYENILAFGGWDNTVHVLDTNTLAPVATRGLHTTRVVALSVAADGSLLASGSEDGTVHLWAIDENGVSDDPLQTFTHLRLSDVVLSEQTLFTASLDGTIQQWQLSNGQAVATFAGHTGWVNDIALSADGTQLASASDDGTVRIWDIATGETVTMLEIAGNADGIVAVAYSADGRFVAAAGGQQIVVWHTDTIDGPPIITFREHTAPITTLQFSAESTLLASADNSGQIRLYVTP